MATVESAVTECRQFIGGEWVDAAGGGTFEDLDPFTGEVVARVSAGGREDARRAVEAAAAAFQGAIEPTTPTGRRRPIASVPGKSDGITSPIGW